METPEPDEGPPASPGAAAPLDAGARPDLFAALAEEPGDPDVWPLTWPGAAPEPDAAEPGNHDHGPDLD